MGRIIILLWEELNMHAIYNLKGLALLSTDISLPEQHVGYARRYCSLL